MAAALLALAFAPGVAADVATGVAIGVATGVAAVFTAGPAAVDDDSVRSLRAEIDAIGALVDRNARGLAELRASFDDDRLASERSELFRLVVMDAAGSAGRRSSWSGPAAVASGYDDGFFIASPDGSHRLVVNAQMQARFALSRLSSRSLAQLNAGTNQPPATGPLGSPPGGTEIRGFQGFVGAAPARVARTARGFEVRDMKLTFSGHVVDPSWQFQVTLNEGRTSSQTAFTQVGTSGGPFGVSSSGPVADNASAGPGTAGGAVEIEYAFVTKRFDEQWSVTMGQFKSPLLKEELISSSSQLLIQRSLSNQFFSAKFTQGVAVEFQDEAIRLVASFNDGGNDSNGSAIIGNDRRQGTFSDGALTARAEWKVAGAWRRFDDMTSVPGEPFGMVIGGAANWQRGGARIASAVNDTWGVESGANGGLVPSGVGVWGSGIPILVPAAAIQYPNNLPVNANSPASNITWTADALMHVEGFSLFAALMGNIATGMPAGWIANPSGGFTPLAGTGNGPGVVPGNISLVPGNGSDGGAFAFVPGAGGGADPIVSLGATVLAGLFVTDEIQLYGGVEWYATLGNGWNEYAGNTASFWGWLPGGSSPFANASQGNGAGPVPDGAATPDDAYAGGQTNPSYDFDFGGNPYAAQMNSAITLGAAWYPASYRNRQVKIMGEVSVAMRPVLFQHGIYGQSVNSDDWRNDGGQPGGGQVVVRLQVQLVY